MGPNQPIMTYATTREQLTDNRSSADKVSRKVAGVEMLRQWSSTMTTLGEVHRVILTEYREVESSREIGTLKIN